MVPLLGQRQQKGNLCKCPNAVGKSTDKKQLEFKGKTACLMQGSVLITCDEKVVSLQTVHRHELNFLIISS